MPELRVGALLLRATGAPPLGRMPWLVPATLAAHVLEELPRFPEWATRHFGTTSAAFFVLSHIPLLVAVVYIAQRASSSMPAALWLWLLVVVQAVLATNGVFHVVTTVWFREYSPGILTGVGLYAPITAYFLPRAAVHLGTRRTSTACATGALVSGSFVASLWLDITFV